MGSSQMRRTLSSVNSERTSTSRPAETEDQASTNLMCYAPNMRHAGGRPQTLCCRHIDRVPDVRTHGVNDRRAQHLGALHRLRQVFERLHMVLRTPPLHLHEKSCDEVAANGLPASTAGPQSHATRGLTVRSTRAAVMPASRSSTSMSTERQAGPSVQTTAQVAI